jgi:hypothetical protein
MLNMFHFLATTMKEWKVRTTSLNSILEGTVSKLRPEINIRNLTVCVTQTLISSRNMSCRSNDQVCFLHAGKLKSVCCKSLLLMMFCLL